MACRFRTSPAIGRAVFLAVALVGIPAWASAQELEHEALIAAMQKGGLVIYVRHAATEADYADQVTAEMGDCSTQRMLSEAGWAEARRIGRAFQDYDIPVGTVLSSEYCRAWQTADLAFGAYQSTPDLNFVKAESYTDDELAIMHDRVVPLLSRIPDTGNTVLVGHDDPFDAATGIYPVPQGVAYVVRPEGNGEFTILGHMAPDEWWPDD